MSTFHSFEKIDFKDLCSNVISHIKSILHVFLPYGWKNFGLVLDLALLFFHYNLNFIIYRGKISVQTARTLHNLSNDIKISFSKKMDIALVCSKPSIIILYCIYSVLIYYANKKPIGTVDTYNKIHT